MSTAKPKRKRSPYRLPAYVSEIDRLSLAQVGLPGPVQATLFAISLLPVVGLILGGYYSSQSHPPTRAFGRMILGFAVILHTVYVCFVCPALLYLSLSRIL